MIQCAHCVIIKKRSWRNRSVCVCVCAQVLSYAIVFYHYSFLYFKYETIRSDDNRGASTSPNPD